MSTGLEGRIQITLTRVDQGVTAARIHSTRPQVAQKLMAGHGPEQVEKLAGMVFSLCGKAQALAARLACAAARGEVDANDGGHLAVWAELAREHAWRLLIDWPNQSGLQPAPEALLRLRQAGDQDPEALAATLEDILAQSLLGEPAQDWLARDAAGLANWIANGATTTARLFAELVAGLDGPDLGATRLPLLPSLDELGPAGLADLARQALDEPTFCAAPQWGNEPPSPAETGAIGRCQAEPWVQDWQARRGRGAGARMLARLLELARLPQRLRTGASSPASSVNLEPGLGAAGVETSRGLLVHAVQLAQDRVVQYRILAPTEWNFHPDGPLAQALLALPTGIGLEARAKLVAQALDPCVDYGLEVK